MGTRPTYLIIRNLREDDKATLEYLYKRYYSKLYGFANKFRLGPVSSDDIVQQTFLKIWEHRALLKENVPFEKQLYSIGKNTILNHLKREGRNISFEDMAVVKEPLYQDHGNIPLKDERLELVYEKIREMPARRREIFELHKFHGLSYNEISEKLKISKNTIANHLQLATNFLKKECQEPPL